MPISELMCHSWHTFDNGGVMRVVVLNATFNNISFISWRCLVNGTEKLCIILKFKKFQKKKKYFLILVHNF